MSSVNISLRKEAYDFLKYLKGKDRSFSEVILGFKKEKKDLLDFFGVLRDSSWKAKEEAMKSFRISVNRRMK